MDSLFIRLYRAKLSLTRSEQKVVLNIGSSVGYPVHFAQIPVSFSKDLTSEGKRKFDKRFNDTICRIRSEIYGTHERLIEGIEYSIKADKTKCWYSKARSGLPFIVDAFDESTVRTFRAFGCGTTMLRDISRALDTCKVRIKGLEGKIKKANLLSDSQILGKFEFGTIIRVKNRFTGCVTEKSGFW